MTPTKAQRKFLSRCGLESAGLSREECAEIITKKITAMQTEHEMHYEACVNKAQDALEAAFNPAMPHESRRPQTNSKAPAMRRGITNL